MKRNLLLFLLFLFPLISYEQESIDSLTLANHRKRLTECDDCNNSMYPKIIRKVNEYCEKQEWCKALELLERLEVIRPNNPLVLQKTACIEKQLTFPKY